MKLHPTNLVEYGVNDIGKFFDLDIVIQILERYNKELVVYEKMRYERNKISEEIGRKAIAGEDATGLREVAKLLKEEYKMFEEDVEETKRWLLYNTCWLAEIPHTCYFTIDEIEKLREKAKNEGLDYEELKLEREQEKYLENRFVREYPGKLWDHKSAVTVDLAEEELRYVRKLIKEKENKAPVAQ